MVRTAQVECVENDILVMNNDIPRTDGGRGEGASRRRFWSVSERPYKVANPENLALAKGDTVEIYLPPGRTILTATLFFLFPLALFPVGYKLTEHLFSTGRIPFGSLEVEAAAFLAGFVFLAAGMPLGVLIRRLGAGRNSGLPIIQKVLSPEEAACILRNRGCDSCSACG